MEQLVCFECGAALGGWMVNAGPHGIILCNGCKEAADEEREADEQAQWVAKPLV